LKNKFGQGYQIELKTLIADRDDEDFVHNATVLASSVIESADEEAAIAVADASNVYFNHDQTIAALETLTSDSFLADKVSVDDPSGYGIWKDSTSATGVSLDELSAFATIELRMRSIANFVTKHFPRHVLRERQDSKAR
jgi:hypothetical protein